MWLCLCACRYGNVYAPIDMDVSVSLCLCARLCVLLRFSVFAEMTLSVIESVPLPTCLSL